MSGTLLSIKMLLDLKNKNFNEIIKKMLELEPNQRPSMDDVCKMLVNFAPNAGLDPTELFSGSF